jgi:hypothetical protein
MLIDSRIALVLFCGLMVSGCSSMGLSTASITGSEAKKAAPVRPAAPVVVTDPMRRAVKIGELSAKAEKCGYNFDAARLRTAFLANEVQQGLDAAATTKLTNTYDLARKVTLQEIGEGEGYCTAARTEAIKPALNQVLAGNFVVTETPRPETKGGLLGDLATSSSGGQLNPNWGRSMDEPLVSRPRPE